MDIVITGWALDSYLDLKHEGAFTALEYKDTIRPDVLLLKNFPSDSKFKVNGFWGVFRTHLELIKKGQYTECGRLT